MSRLIATGLSYAVGGTPIVSAADLRIAPGELVALLGANGAGKSTLLRLALGLTKPDTGTSALSGRDIRSLGASERARTIAYLPQSRPLAWPVRVRDVVALGRFAHGAAIGRLGPVDAAAVDRALIACDLNDLADRAADTLSGGEAARMHCARAFAAETALLIADEPVAALDPRHQYRVLDLIRGYVDHGGGALIVLHDISLAARYADRLIWIQAGRITADGPVADTLTEHRIRETYGIRAAILHRDGQPHVIVDGAD